MKPNLPLGTVIENKAWVRYNYGDSIETNKVSNVIVDPDSYPENSILSGVHVYPNPSGNTAIIETILGSGFYMLSDITGKTLLQGKVNSEKFTLNLGNLSSGVYFITVINSEHQVNGKIIKE